MKIGEIQKDSKACRLGSFFFINVPLKTLTLYTEYCKVIMNLRSFRSLKINKKQQNHLAKIRMVQREGVS